MAMLKTICVKLIPGVDIYSHIYTGNVQTFTAEITGSHKLEVWGSNAAMGSGGGNANGTYFTSKNSKLYVCIGGNRGYNGGIPPVTAVAFNPGGGATHIATTDRGELKSYSSYKSEVLIVAGGSGSGEWSGAVGGSGGGTTGGSSNYNVALSGGGTKQTSAATGGTQSAGGTTALINNQTATTKANGSFGQGGYAMAGTDAGGCGGGGWYGGGGCLYVGAGGGGSGYINDSKVSNGSMKNGVNSGDGKALITWMPVL